MHGMKDKIAPYPMVASLMMEIPSGFFAHNDEKTVILDGFFSDQIPKYCSFSSSNVMILNFLNKY